MFNYTSKTSVCLLGTAAVGGGALLKPIPLLSTCKHTFSIIPLKIARLVTFQHLLSPSSKVWASRLMGDWLVVVGCGWLVCGKGSRWENRFPHTHPEFIF